MDLIVRDLPVAGNETAAVAVTGEHRSSEALRGLPEAFVSKMSDVQNHADRLHGAQEFDASRAQPAGKTGAVSVGTGAVMRETQHSQPLLPPWHYILGRQNWICTLHTEDVT